MIRIKPHHFIDILAAFGRGQTHFEPHPYGHAVHTVAAAILQDPDVQLEIELGADDICSPCRHNVNGLCDDTIDTSFRPAAPASKREYNLLIDQRWCQRLGLAQGDCLSAREFCERVRERMGRVAEVYDPANRISARVRELKAGLRRFKERKNPVVQDVSLIGVYLDVARSPLEAYLVNEHGTGTQLTREAGWGIMTISHTFSFMAVEAFVNYYLNSQWNRPDSVLRREFHGAGPFESLKTKLGDLSARLKLLCRAWGIPPISTGDPALWRDFTEFLERNRHFMVHPVLDGGALDKARRSVLGKNSPRPNEVASRLIAYFYEKRGIPVPSWVGRSTHFRFGTIVVLNAEDRSPTGQGDSENSSP